MTLIFIASVFFASMLGFVLGWSARNRIAQENERYLETVHQAQREREGARPPAQRRTALAQEAWVADMVERGEDPGRDAVSAHTSPWRDRRPF